MNWWPFKRYETQQRRECERAIGDARRLMRESTADWIEEGKRREADLMADIEMIVRRIRGE